MRVTVDAAMRTRDVSRVWTGDDAADRPRAADARPSPDRARGQGPAVSNGPDRAAAADGDDRGTPARGEGGDPVRDDGAQRERRGKADRRRLGKRHARVRR
jgi:hypothetical protein